LPYVDTLIGTVAAFCTTASYIPQLQKSWATRQTDDLSAKMLILLLGGLSFWVVYGFLRDDIVIIATNGISVALVATILCLKFRKSNCRGQLRWPKRRNFE
jgi:MtN3 and saliva related transmembrane protein